MSGRRGAAYLATLVNVARTPSKRRTLPGLALALLFAGPVPAIRAQISLTPDPAQRAQDLFHLAEEARRQGDDQTAVRLLSQVAALDPQAVLPRLEWAASLLALNLPEGADQALAPIRGSVEETAEANPHQAARWMRLEGAVEQRAGHHAEALRLYERAAGFEPTDIGLRAQLIGLYRARGEEARAVPHLRAVADLLPGNAELRVELGRALLSLERWDEAARAFREALGVRSDLDPAWDGLGVALTAQGHMTEAEDVLRQGIQLVPRSSLLHEHLGDVLFADGRFNAALTAYQRAALLGPADRETLAHKIDRVRAKLEP